jgi:hypothetical protein
LFVGYNPSFSSMYIFGRIWGKPNLVFTIMHTSSALFCTSIWRASDYQIGHLLDGHRRLFTKLSAADCLQNSRPPLVTAHVAGSIVGAVNCTSRRSLVGIVASMEDSKNEEDYTRDLTNWNYLVSTFDNDVAFEASTSPTDASGGQDVDLDHKPPPRTTRDDTGSLLLSSTSASLGQRALSPNTSLSGAGPSNVEFARGGMTRSAVGVPSSHMTGDIWQDAVARMPFQPRPIPGLAPGAAAEVSYSPMWNPAEHQTQRFSPTQSRAAQALLHGLQLPLSSASAAGLPRSDLNPFSQPLRHDREAILPQLWNRGLSEPWILGQDQRAAQFHPAAPSASSYLPSNPTALPSHAASTAHQQIRAPLPSASEHVASWHHQQHLPQARAAEQSAEMPAFVASLPINAPVSIEEAKAASGARAKPRVRKRTSKKKAGAKATVLKPMSAYNYYFRDERYNIIKWKGEGLPPPASDWSEERQRALLHEHWFLDPVRERRPHRKTEGKLGFTGYVLNEMPATERETCSLLTLYIILS